MSGHIYIVGIIKDGILKLVKFSVSNFRSIQKAHDIRLSQSTILIGRNNEGKSNVVKALNIAMNTLKHHASEESAKARLKGSLTRSLIREPRLIPFSASGSSDETESIHLKIQILSNLIVQSSSVQV